MAKCKHFGKCGGCSTQHIDYSVELENKKKVLAEAIGLEDIKVFSGAEYNYRNRMDFIFTSKGLGFREKGKWYSAIDVERCEIANENVNKILEEVREEFSAVDPFHIAKHTGTYRYAVVRSLKHDSSVSFVLNADSSRLKEAVEKIKVFAGRTSARNVVVTYVPENSDMAVGEDYFVVKGKDMIEEEYMAKKFKFSVQGFFQNNTNMAEKMHEHVNSLLKNYDTKESELLDLYGGVGTFGIINAELFDKVAIVEDHEGSIQAAKKNIKENSAINARALAMDAKNIGKAELGKKLFIITDPPRSGMHPKTIKKINELNPEAFVYVSCNAKQLAKELPLFKNYEIASVAIFDLFPKTKHFETVVELVKRL